MSEAKVTLTEAELDLLWGSKTARWVRDRVESIVAARVTEAKAEIYRECAKMTEGTIGSNEMLRLAARCGERA